MVEAGLAVIAACLPTLQFLIRKFSLDRMISSIRSAFSLQSLRSQSSGLGPKGPYINMRADSKKPSGPSVEKIVGRGETSEDLAMSSMTGTAVSEDAIHVTKHLSQHDDLV